MCGKKICFVRLIRWLFFDDVRSRCTYERVCDVYRNLARRNRSDMNSDQRERSNKTETVLFTGDSIEPIHSCCLSTHTYLSPVFSRTLCVCAAMCVCSHCVYFHCSQRVCSTVAEPFARMYGCDEPHTRLGAGSCGCIKIFVRIGINKHRTMSATLCRAKENPMETVET